MVFRRLSRVIFLASLMLLNFRAAGAGVGQGESNLFVLVIGAPSESSFGIGEGVSNLFALDILGLLRAEGISDTFVIDNRGITRAAELTVAVQWERTGGRLEISAYGFDRRTGRLISTGTGLYSVRDAAGTEVAGGSLSYNSDTGAWKSGFFSFARTGEFTATVWINTYFGAQTFTVGAAWTGISGAVSILGGGAAGGATVKLYTRAPASESETPQDTRAADEGGHYQFANLSPGYYWLRATNAQGLKGGVAGLYANGPTTRDITLANYRVPLDALGQVRSAIRRFYDDQNQKMIELSADVDGDVGRSWAENLRTGLDIFIDVAGVVKSIVQIQQAVNLHNQLVTNANQFKYLAAEASWTDPGLQAFWTNQVGPVETSLVYAREQLVQKTAEKATERLGGLALKEGVKSFFRLEARGDLNLLSAVHELLLRTFSADFLNNYVLSTLPWVGSVAENLVKGNRADVGFSGSNHRRTLSDLTNGGSQFGGNLYTMALGGLDRLMTEFANGCSLLQPSPDADLGRLEDIAQATVGMVDLSRKQKDVNVFTPYGEGVPFNFNGVYVYYKGIQDQMNAVLAAKYGLTVLKGAALVVGFGTGPVGVGAALAFGVITTVADQLYEQANLQLSEQAGQAYAMAAAQWAGNVAIGPFILERLVTDGLHEMQKPCYLNRNNQFRLEMTGIDLHPDYVSPLTGRKVIFRWDWGSLIPGGLPGFNFTRTMPLSLTLKNTGSKAFVRVAALSKQASLATSFGNAVRSGLKDWDLYQVSSVAAWPESGIRYLEPNQTANVELNYAGRYAWPVGLFRPNKIEIIPFAGPFPKPSKIEEYWVFNNLISVWELFSTKEELVRVAAKEPEKILFPARTRAGLVSLQQAMELTTAQKSSDEFYLSAATPEFSKTVTTSATADKLIVELYPALGADVDLHLYEAAYHVGFTTDTGQVEIGFPCAYSGPDSRPETATVPNAANRTFTLTARLNRVNSSMEIPCTLLVSEEPKRPDPILSVESLRIKQTADPNTTQTLQVGVAEISGQNPLQNLRVSVDSPRNAKDEVLQQVITEDHPTSYTQDILPAGEMRRCDFVFRVPANASGTYSGKATVSTDNAGSLEVDLIIEMKLGNRDWLLYQ